MWLFMLCGLYCEYFAVVSYHNRDELNYAVNQGKQKGYEVLNYINKDPQNILGRVCWNYKLTDVITEPGYLCNVVVFNSSRCSVNYTEIFTGNMYCCNYQYIPHSLNSSSTSKTPQLTPKITQEPCQRLRIRVVYALVQTLIE